MRLSWPSWRFPVGDRRVVGATVVAAFLLGGVAGALVRGGGEPEAATTTESHQTTGVVDLDSTTGAGDPDSTAAASPVDSSTGKATYVEMHNVIFHVHPEIALGIRRLRGTMRSVSKGPIVFDDPRSFTINISSAEVHMTPQNLTNLLNKHVFAYPGAPLRALEVRIDGNQLVQKGRLRKGLSIPFEIRSTVSLTPDGQIRIHAERTKLVGVGATRLMRMLGIKLGSVVNLDQARGARIDGNDILLDVEHALPPPVIRGRLVDVRIENGEMVQRFGPRGAVPAESPVPDPSARNYMFYKGGTLRFGKLMMLDADMQIVDLDPSDHFRFDLSRYMTQLVAGYSKTLPDGGLEVFMKDIDDAAATPAVRR